MLGKVRKMSKVNFEKVIFTSADAAEALETIEFLARDGRDVIVARIMRDDPHEPPTWWHVRPMLNLTLLARTAAAQAGIAPPPDQSFPLGNTVDPVVAEESLSLLKAALNRWQEGVEPIPPALLPTYQSQTWIDFEKLEYDLFRAAYPPRMGDHDKSRTCMEEYKLSNLLEEIHPTEETIHGPRFHICYDQSDLNIQVSPSFIFAKGVPGKGIRATGAYLIWVVGKPPDFAIEMAGPDKAAEDLTTKRELYRQIGIGEYWRLDPTGGDLYGAPLAADKLVDGQYRPIPIDKLKDGNHWGYSEAARIHIAWFEGEFVYLGPPKDD